MFKKRMFSSLLLVMFLSIGTLSAVGIRPVSAYKSGSGSTHEFIFNQANQILRNDGYDYYANLLDSIEPSSGLTYLQIMIKGSNENDKMPYESLNPDQWCSNHYLDPFDHSNPIPFAIKSAGSLCQERFDEAVSHWESGNYYDAMYDLGWAAHLVQDLCVPHHAWPRALDWHTEYESWVDSNKNLYSVSSGGIYSFPSFSDRNYYPSYNSGTPSQSYWHYKGDNPTAYDWVDYNAHESIKYINLVDGNNDTSGLVNDEASPFVETIHPLPNNFKSNFTFPQDGAWIRLLFDKIDLEDHWDYLRLYDGLGNSLENFTGAFNNYWTDWYYCPWPMTIEVTTDGSVQSWGYRITRVQYDSLYDSLDFATGILLSQAQRTSAGFTKFFLDRVLAPVHIRSDGSIYPPNTPLQRNGNLYTLLSNIPEPIIVETDNIVIDGNGWKHQALCNLSDGFYLPGRNNITITNMTIEGFKNGAFIRDSTGIVLSDTSTKKNQCGFALLGSTYCEISSNCITANSGYGVLFVSCSNNDVVGNNISANNRRINVLDSVGYGIYYDSCFENNASDNNIDSHASFGACFHSSSHNVLTDNNLTNSFGTGFYSSSDCNIVSQNNITSYYLYNIILSGSASNEFYHNNIGGSWYNVGTSNSTNTWDDGYPSGGNYWSYYAEIDEKKGPYQNETGNDGIGDSPYVIDSSNLDNYPLMTPYSGPHDIGATVLNLSKTIVGKGYCMNSSLAVINYGKGTETFNTTLVANGTDVQTQSVSLSTRNSTTIPFVWNTTDFPYGNYTIGACAWPVQNETDIADNNYTCVVPIHVGVPGDVSSSTPGVYDKKCDMKDIAYLVILFNTKPTSPNWNPNADVDNNGVVSMIDIAIAILNFNKHE